MSELRRDGLGRWQLAPPGASDQYLACPMTTMLNDAGGPKRSSFKDQLLILGEGGMGRGAQYFCV